MYRPFLNGRRGYRLLCVKIQSIDKHDLSIMRSLYSIVQRTLSVLKAEFEPSISLCGQREYVHVVFTIRGRLNQRQACSYYKTPSFS
jgi:hypothetical protein